jgi:L-iditol 2-dehydrogenase
MAERCPAWGKYCFEMPDSMSFEEAAMLDVVGVGVHATRLAGISSGMSVVVFGVGPIGNAIMQASRAMGAEKVFAVDTYDMALVIADECGATLTINAAKANVITAVRDANGGNCSAVFDTVGTKETLHTGLGLLSEGGTLINMAVHDAELSINSLNIGSERSIRTSCNFLPEEFPLSLSMVSSGRINVKPWVTHRFSLKDIKQAFDIALNKEENGAFKVVVMQQGGG